jgi:hypothetical protein
MSQRHPLLGYGEQQSLTAKYVHNNKKLFEVVFSCQPTTKQHIEDLRPHTGSPLSQSETYQHVCDNRDGKKPGKTDISVCETIVHNCTLCKYLQIR